MCWPASAGDLCVSSLCPVNRQLSVYSGSMWVVTGARTGSTVNVWALHRKRQMLLTPTFVQTVRRKIKKTQSTRKNSMTVTMTCFSNLYAVYRYGFCCYYLFLNSRFCLSMPSLHIYYNIYIRNSDGGFSLRYIIIRKLKCYVNII